MTDLADFSASDLLASYRRRELSPVEVTQAVLGRIAAWDGTLGAMFAVHEGKALAAAAASEKRWAKGEARALDGVPVTVKDNIATEGTPVPLGTAASLLVPATEDAPPAARANAAGAILVGKTTMPDYGMLSSGLSSYHRLARNPWDVSKNPGGSSAGAAVAASAGYGPLHIGTDIGGSVRLPAGWCGIFALKPSLGRIPIDPPYIGRVAGPMTRDVADSALLMSVLSAPDARDYMSLPPADIAWTELDHFTLKGLRIGLMMQAGTGLAVDSETMAAVHRAALLFEGQGAIVEPLDPFLTRDMMDGLDLFWRTRLWSEFVAMPADRVELVLPFIRAWAEGAVGADGLAVFAGFSRIMEIRAAGNRAMQGVDFILSPTAPIAAFAAELPCPTGDPATPFEHIAFTVPFNMTEQPACSVNCGFTQAGLPIGLQIVGRRFDDLGVLRLARAFEALREPMRAWPGFPFR
jgi:Asp-tRNA(Asn)/Glu-tRNA(Gln) amidotransferase A subunit family amidase